MTDYVKSTNFASKDSLPTGNPAKIVKGTEIDTEFNNIATAVSTKVDKVDPTATANGVTYYNGSKLLSSGSALTFNGSSLGVGTGAPAYKLDVAGDGQFSVASSDSILKLTRTTTSAGSGWLGANSAYSFIVYSGDLSKARQFSVAQNAPTDALTLDAFGSLGLGVTPSAWGSGVRTLDIGFGSALTNANSFTDTWLSSQWLYKNSAAASYYQQASGAHRWFTAPSGTAGNTISFTQAMWLDASSNLNVAGSVTASGGFVGNITGSVVGNVTGNLTGNVTGNLTGDVTGNVTGDVTGNVTGNAGTVTNGVYTTGNQTIAGDKTFTGSIATGSITATGAISASGNVTASGGTVTIGSSALAPTGSAPSYTARAWVNFNGTGTVAIRSSGNVSSITDNGVGIYTVNFTTAMPDANYSASISVGTSGAGSGYCCTYAAPTTTTYRLVGIYQGASPTFNDYEFVCVSIFR
jgi:hypothetical protein